jgi:2-polyprenyl-3-methyl-5-hydroxy-6-metoxy-1,4-benzoquinol methylase
MSSIWKNQIIKIANQLEKNSIPYIYVKETALAIQGIDPGKLHAISVEVQWDVFEKAQSILDRETEIQRGVTSASFTYVVEEISVQVTCTFNSTVKTNPFRTLSIFQDQEVWVQSLYAYINGEQNNKLSTKIHAFLQKKQAELSAQNMSAWNQEHDDALVQRYGDPRVVVAKIKENPTWRLQPFYAYLGNVKGKKILHLMGSNGIKATAMGLLGADVTVVDFSKDNATYAKRLADEADIKMDYRIMDVLTFAKEAETNAYDIVLLELGVLHYWIDLMPLTHLIQKVLKSNGRLVLHEFHPISTKLITSTGKKRSVDGNYFDPNLVEVPVAFSKHIAEQQQPLLTKSLQRKWTLGEVLTAIGQAKLNIRVVEEEPNHKLHDIGLPKTYTVVAEK